MCAMHTGGAHLKHARVLAYPHAAASFGHCLPAAIVVCSSNRRAVDEREAEQPDPAGAVIDGEMPARAPHAVSAGALRRATCLRTRTLLHAHAPVLAPANTDLAVLAQSITTSPSLPEAVNVTPAQHTRKYSFCAARRCKRKSARRQGVPETRETPSQPAYTPGRNFTVSPAVAACTTAFQLESCATYSAPCALAGCHSCTVHTASNSHRGMLEWTTSNADHTTCAGLS